MDIIKLLPDSIANQIAAGEVIQRPMSVVKELVENAIDAGAQNIIVNIWDAGKTEITVIDDGKGMNPSDARLSIERHATSKIEKSEDLFNIHTMGFRGEALASIASIAHLEIKSRREEDELGTQIKIEASEIISQEQTNCSKGSSFSVKNLFCNVPARRNFLKSNKAELKHITTSLYRIVMCYPEISFKMFVDGKLTYNLPKSNIKQRIVNTIGSVINPKLIDIKTDTSIVKISGFITKPEYAKKSYGDQYFFINGRFMKHPGFHKAIVNAYDRLLQPNTIPCYFIYLETDPQFIDINVHPTKTEIKFRDEQSIFQIIQATVKESLGKFNIMDGIDFNQAGVEIPIFNESKQVEAPASEIDESYNPFASDTENRQNSVPEVEFSTNVLESKFNNAKPKTFVSASSKINEDWDKLYTSFESKADQIDIIDSEQDKLFSEKETSKQSKFIQLKNRYILTPVKSGLMVIDQKRAKERILFDQLLKSEELKQKLSKQLLFPHEIELSNSEFDMAINIVGILNNLGFDIVCKENNTLEVKAIPTLIKEKNIDSIIDQFLEQLKNNNIENFGTEFIAQSISKLSGKKFITPLKEIEMEDIFNQLFASSNPNYTNNGSAIIKIMSMDNIIEGL